MRNVKLTLTYDGGNYKGWQKSNAGASIEETLEEILKKILQQPITLQAASRTDAGVHAEGQVVNFFLHSSKIQLTKLYISLNQLLPRDIIVTSCEEMPISFHPTLDARGKTYRYFICYSRSQRPYHRAYSWHCHYPLDLTSMKNAAQLLVGKYDFSAFCNKRRNRPNQNPIRELTRVTIEPIEGQRLCITIEGKSFLYQMVRNLVGMLVSIGRKRMTIDDLLNIIASKKRANAAASAPAHGLFLHHVEYATTGSN